MDHRSAGVLSFELLGSLRVRRGDREIDPGAGKQRAVLAVLVLNANTPVWTAQIVDAVWADEPPENGANVVQKYVAGLRKALEPERSPRAPGELLTRSGGGYLLRVAPDAVDIAVFDRLVQQARAAQRAGRLSEAASDFRAALAMWRGEALAGLAGARFDGERRRLAESRLAAVEALAETSLALGRHLDLVPELTRLIAEHPSREQLYCLLMVALYRSGRQSEALDAYRQARQFLDAEFGIEPGDRLREVHQAILRSDPELAAPEVAGSTRDLALPSRPPAGRAAPTPVVPDPGSPTVGPANAPTAGRRRWPSWLARIALALTALGTFGFATWAIVAALAVHRRSAGLGAAAVGYLALTTIAFLTLLQPDSTWLMQAIGTAAVLVPLLGGPAHLLTIDPRRSRPVPTKSPDPAVLHAADRHARRELGRLLLRDHPALADTLHIGRPHLPHRFDDGGLVDLNAVPEGVLAALLDLDLRTAVRIVASRRRDGAFGTVDELTSRGLLSTAVLDKIRPILVAAPPNRGGTPQTAVVGPPLNGKVIVPPARRAS